MCSGQHSVFILLAKLGGWELETYWQEDHPAQAAVREAVAAAFAVDPGAHRDRHRRLRDPHLRVPAARGRPGVRDPRRPGGAARRRPAGGARAALRRDPRRDDRPPGAGRRDPRPARHVADEGVERPAREQERHGGAARRRDPARPRAARAPPASGIAIKIEDGDGYDRGHVGRDASRRSARSGVLEGQALRVLSRYHRPPLLDPHGRAGGRGRSRRSSSRPSASWSADRPRPTEMNFQGDPFRTLGITPERVAQRDPVGVPPAREAVPPRHGRRARAAAVPRDPGGLRAARRRRGPAASRGRRRVRHRGGRASRGARDPTRARASRDAWRARRAGGSTAAGGRATGRDAGRGGDRAGARAPGRAATARPAARGDEAPPRRAPPRRGSRKATPGLHDLRRGRRAPLDPEWDGGSWYGQSSGTYWTINPREYADPRKHGPEYHARARAPRGPRRRNVGHGRVGRSATRPGRDPRRRRGPSPNGAGADASEPDPATRLGLERPESTTTAAAPPAGGRAAGPTTTRPSDATAATDRRRSRSHARRRSPRSADPLPGPRGGRPPGRRPRTCSRSRAGPAGGGGSSSRCSAGRRSGYGVGTLLRR